jgi:DNA-directed RNA polymerase subunit B'
MASTAVDMFDSFYASNRAEILNGDTPITYHRFDLHDDGSAAALLDPRISIDQIFQEAQIKHGPIQTNITTFDNWVQNLLPIQIESKRTPRYKDRVYFFTNVRYQRPRHPLNDKEFLFPHVARREMLTYYSVVTADSVWIPAPGTPGAEDVPPVVTIAQKDVEIMKLPVMLGSVLCNLHGYTNLELRQVYEDACDPMGYFIVKGSERIVLLQENLVPMKRFSVLSAKPTKDQQQMILDASSSSVVARSDIKTIFTTQAIVGSTVVTIKGEKNNQTLNVLVSQKGHKGASPSKIEYPILLLIDLILQLASEEQYGYDLYDVENIRNKEEDADGSADARVAYEAYTQQAQQKRAAIVQFVNDNIGRYVRREYLEAVLNFIQPSIQVYLDKIASARNTIVDIMKIYNHSIPTPPSFSSRPPVPQHKLDPTTGQMTDKTDTEYHFEYISAFIDDTFSSVNYIGKANSMLRLAAQHILTTIGIRAPDDRDSWGNKRIKFAHENLAQVVNGNFKVELFEKSASDPVLTASVKSLFDIFVTSFGNAGFNNKKDAVESLRRNNQVLPVSTICRINPGAKRQTKQLTIRSVQPTQLGVVCPYETPTGAMCGLTKNMCVTTSVSLRRDPVQYRNEVLEKVLTKCGYPENLRNYSPPDNRIYSIVLNGEVIAWCDLNVIETPLRIETKRNLNFFDVGIFSEPEEMTIEIFTVGGRPLRPLLTTTPDSSVRGHLLINSPEVLRRIAEKAPGLMTIMDFVKAGAIEFVHIDEQNRATVAETLERVKDIYQKRMDALADEAKFGSSGSGTAKEQDDDEEEAGQQEDEDAEQQDEEDADWGEEEDAEQHSLKPAPGGVPQKGDKIGTFMGRTFPVYCELNPVAVFGVAAGNMPYQNTCQGPRVTYQANMANQAQGNHHDFSYSRFDSSAKRTDTGRGFLETQISTAIGNKRAPHGRMMMVAIIALANNGEDGIVAHQEATENIRIVKTVSHRMILKNIGSYDMDTTSGGATGRGGGGEVYRDFLAPPLEKALLERHSKEGRNIFHAIGPDGLPRIGAEIKRGDCIISRKKDIKSQVNGNIELIDVSLFAGIGDDGIIDRVETVRIRNAPTGAGGGARAAAEEKSSGKIVRVKIRKSRPIITGDKFASRYSQKGTIAAQRTSTGFILDKSEISEPAASSAGGGDLDFFTTSHFAKSVPVVSSGPFAGMMPDLIINPHGQPSRMTAGMMMEMLASKASLFSGERIDGTAYRQPSRAKIEEWRKILQDNGCDPDGFEEMVHPDNTKLKVKVFIAPCYYQGLHLVSDKIQFRNRGRIVHLTNQPVSGRAHGGGLRNGEMEKSAMCSWGATSVLLDRLKNASDHFPLEICRTCGNQATVSYKHNNIRLCLVCGKANQDIGIINTTYISILINRILLAMGIHATYSSVRKLEPSEVYE